MFPSDLQHVSVLALLVEVHLKASVWATVPSSHACCVERNTKSCGVCERTGGVRECWRSSAERGGLWVDRHLAEWDTPKATGRWWRSEWKLVLLRGPHPKPLSLNMHSSNSPLSMNSYVHDRKDKILHCFCFYPTPTTIKVLEKKNNTGAHYRRRP